ncbi:hypothetical protein PCASD_12000 [Puccinia coronata f. sp. avenae]|uniref:Uncharacterized protein n=1 Tax=Puccinia coronata f. sp. avenae TaxID=200324 RepID=A0A2N5UA67_9BASI|nr:hypothetical protein PCASD_12000 [Puccinia coronata f. sp. avenae]
MANISPKSNTVDTDEIQVRVVPPPRPSEQEPPLSHGAAPTTGTTTSNQTDVESSASQTTAPAKSISESQEDSRPKKRKLTSDVWEHFTKITDILYILTNLQSKGSPKLSATIAQISSRQHQPEEPTICDATQKPV